MPQTDTKDLAPQRLDHLRDLIRQSGVIRVEALCRQLGVSPGGDIMIHGIKNGYSGVGDLHAEVDWTKGCIAVTDEEIEEIDKLAPIGTIVDIRP